MKTRVLLSCFCAFALAAPAFAQLSPAPLPEGEEVFWAHAPFEMGECSLCHEGSDPAAPGTLNAGVNELCFSCHEIFQEMLGGFENVHPPVEDSCTECHNPHNSRYAKLLNLETTELCGACHEDIMEGVRTHKVQHDAVTQGQACLTCHDPHATHVQAMLRALPYDLCVDCHGQDGMTDDQGRPMTNLKALIEQGHMSHGPVENKDCSACHFTHSGDNFRMLTEVYPARFYAPYDEQNYALCFECHESEVFTAEHTRTLTGFRDGDRNLHYLHVNKAQRGRTCRSCHEVHAAPQTHLIRDGVPYGSSGWVLKINFQQLENGGSCAKTCHPTKPYDREKTGP